jgi:hypothetical protein
MAASSRDGLVHDATSMDDAHALPSRPEAVCHPVPVFGQPGAVAIRETHLASHRSRRSRTAHSGSPQIPTERMGFLASTGLAVVSLVFVSVVAFGSMLVSAAILHLVSPDRRFDTFRAFHEPLVFGVLFGLAVFWLLPPHPWAAQPAQSEPKTRRPLRAKSAA